MTAQARETAETERRTEREVRLGARRSPDRAFAVGLARAFGGAVFFSLPLLMTMEMWSLGISMSRFRLALFMLLMIPLLIALDHYSGFRETSTWREDAVDAMVAYGVGFAASFGILVLFGVLEAGTPLREAVGMVALQAVPASFGAVLAVSQLGGGGAREEARMEETGYGGELLFMTAGAVFMAFNVAPTEEMIVIAFKMTDGHVLFLVGVSILLMHAFVYAVEFRGTPAAPEGASPWSLFFRFTLVGYAIALAVSAYVLWTFGRYEEASLGLRVAEAVVLGFPASLGAAAARLIL